MRTAVNIIVPLLVLRESLSGLSPDDPLLPVHDEFAAGLLMAYSTGPPFGADLILWRDLDAMGLTHRALRRLADEHLAAMSTQARLHASPPTQIVSFDGIESSLLMADEFWTDLASAMPGDIVAGMPARDVLIITSSESAAGVAKARRCVDRIFFAGDRHLLTRDLLVRRDSGWDVFDADHPAPPKVTSWSGPRHGLAG